MYKRQLPILTGGVTQIKQTLKKIALKTEKLDGRLFYVGGCVRDRILGIDSKAVSYTHLDVYKRQPISIDDGHYIFIISGETNFELSTKHV